jgi:CAAX prenyl protease-like protein
MTDDEFAKTTHRRGWPAAVPFVLPLAAFLLIAAMFPTFEPANSVAITGGTNSTNNEASAPSEPSSAARLYVLLTIVTLIGVCLVLSFCFRTYLRSFPFSVDARGIWVGVVGAVLWIGLCQWGLEATVWQSLTGSQVGLGGRSRFDPWTELASATWRGGFLAARFALLVAAVPLAEEVFLRGFLMRYVQSGEWQDVRLNQLGWPALFAGTLYGVLSHPSEALAAAAWFSLVSWLMIRSGKFWNCVAAHAVTNALLGVYIVAFGRWELW